MYAEKEKLIKVRVTETQARATGQDFLWFSEADAVDDVA